MSQVTETTSPLPSAEPAPQPDGEQMLQIVLGESPMLLPVSYLVEILTLPTSQVVPIFNLPAWVPGVYNWRGDILWIADLGHLLGASPWYQQAGYGAKHTVVVLDRTYSRQLRSEERSPLGLIVNRVEGMQSTDLGSLSQTAPPDRLSDRLLTGDSAQPFILGNSPNGPVLNGDAILDAMP
ncbi:MAG: chemotaxis protein CheW [Cyanobacteria bacterium P01_A01_bin.135]